MNTRAPTRLLGAAEGGASGRGACGTRRAGRSRAWSRAGVEETRTAADGGHMTPRYHVPSATPGPGTVLYSILYMIQ